MGYLATYRESFLESPMSRQHNCILVTEVLEDVPHAERRAIRLPHFWESRVQKDPRNTLEGSRSPERTSCGKVPGRTARWTERWSGDLAHGHVSNVSPGVPHGIISYARSQKNGPCIDARRRDRRPAQDIPAPPSAGPVLLMPCPEPRSPICKVVRKVGCWCLECFLKTVGETRRRRNLPVEESTMFVDIFLYLRALLECVHVFLWNVLDRSMISASKK